MLTLPDGRDLAVVDVHEQGGLIWHTLAPVPDTPCRTLPRHPLTQQIDWDWRLDKMQQHTGEHILSGLLHQMFGAENVGFHIGAGAVRMDTSVPISPEGLRQAELAANQIIWQDVPVRAWYPDKAQLEALCYRSKSPLRAPCASWRSPVRMCAPAAAPM